MRGKAPETEHVDLRRRQLDGSGTPSSLRHISSAKGNISVGELETVERCHCSFVKQLDRGKSAALRRL
jgi:hypothetical protein